MNATENTTNKYNSIPVIRIDYKELTEVCNPPHMIERGDEGDIGIDII